MAQGIDVSELDKYTKNLLETAEKTMPKEISFFINRESQKLTSKTKGEAVKAVFKVSGKYHSSIKKEKHIRKKAYTPEVFKVQTERPTSLNWDTTM